ncbi:MAG: TetR/AcrR family transcriptional regulator [Mycobacteriaceae bacterium]|nr:TetR/AcrR family transcriptional regulator [Mycobacteriaceae bacterium]
MVRPPAARQALLDAVRAELVESASSTDLSTLVSRAGVSTGAVYHHFGSKVGLLAAVYGAFFDGSERAVTAAGQSAGTWTARMHDRIRAMVEYYFTDPLGPVVLARSTEHSAITELEAAYLARAAAGVAANLRAPDAVLPPDLDLDLTAAYLVGGLRRALAQQLAHTPRPTVEATTAALWRLTTATLSQP